MRSPAYARWLRWAVWAVMLALAVTQAASADPTLPVWGREKWPKEIDALYAAALKGDRGAVLALKALAEAEAAQSKKTLERPAAEAYEAAVEAVTARAANDLEARGTLIQLAGPKPRNFRVELGLTEVGKQILAKTTPLTPRDLTDLAVIYGSDRIDHGSRPKAEGLLTDAMAKGDPGVKDALSNALRTNSLAYDTRNLMKAYYAKADPKSFTRDDWVNILLIEPNPSPYDPMGKTVLEALQKDAPGARDALRDLLADRIPGLDLDKKDQFARGYYAGLLVKAVGLKEVTYNQGATHHHDGKITTRIPNFTVADEEALARTLTKMKDGYDRKRVQEALDAWKRPASFEFDRRMDAELNPKVKAYVEAKKASAAAQFTALQNRIKAAGAQGEISQAQADAFRKELFDLAGKVALENQSGGVRSGNEIITPAYLASTILAESKTERLLWDGPSPFGGLKVAREELTSLDRFTIDSIQTTAGLVLSKDERIALEDAVIKENGVALREQMAEQMVLISKTFDKVSAPARNPPSGPLTVLQDFIKYEIGSENSYIAMVDRILPIYDDMNPMWRLIPKKGEAVTPAQYREFMKRRDALLERVRGADANVAKYLESQKEWKDNITSIGAVTAAAVLAIPTGGQSLWITVPVLAGGGVVTKVGLSWGDDYLGGREYTLKDGLKDGVIGAVDGIGVLAGGSLSTAARNMVGKRIGLGLLEKGLTRELNMTGATIMQRFLVHGVTTTSRGATFGAMTGFTRKTYDVVERINAGTESFSLKTLGEIASATALSSGSGAVMDFGFSSAFVGLGKLLPKRAPNAPLDPEVENVLWRLLGAEKGTDAAAATAALKRKFPGGLEAGRAISQEQALALEAYAALMKGKSWVGDPAAMKLEVLAPKVSPSETIAIGDTIAPSPEVFRTGALVRVPRSSGAIDDGWRIEGINADGSIRVGAPGFKKGVLPGTLLEHNPELLRGMRVRTTRTSGVVEENWVVEGMDRGSLRLHQPSTGLRRFIAPDQLQGFMAQNADRWSPSGMSRLLPEQLSLAEARVPTGPARDVSNEFKVNHRLEGSTKIPDGYADGGRGMSISADGVATSGREIIVVDRARDAVLRKHLDVAKEIGDRLKAGKLSEEQAYRELAQYVDRSLSPAGQRALAHDAMNQWLKVAEGREILLGDVTRTEAGMCRHRSLLFKVLGDELSVAAGGKGQVALVRGNLVWSGGEGGHAWNELVLSDGRKVLVDIMNPKEGFRFPSLSEGAASYRKVDSSPFYEAPKTNQTMAFDPNQTMIGIPKLDSALERAKALVDVLDKNPISASATKETVWAGIRAAEARGVGDLYRAQIKDQLIQKLESIERIRTMPGRSAEANAEMASLASRAKAAGYGVEDISAALAERQQALAKLATDVASAKAAGFREYPKHLKAKTDAEALKLSTAKEGGEAVGQYAPSKFGNTAAGDAARAELERAALLDPKAIRVQNGGALHVYYEAPDVVGFANGSPTKWIRVELSGNTIHSHPRAPESFPTQAREQLAVRAILNDNARAPSLGGQRVAIAAPPAACGFTPSPPAP